MPKRLRAILVGILVAFVIGFGITFGLAAAGAEPLSSTWIIAGVIGSFVTMGMMNMAGNKPVAIADDKTRAAVLALKPPPGTGQVIVFREGFFGKANGVNLALDGRFFAQLKSPRFTAINVQPGEHKLSASLAGAMDAGSVPGQASFTLASGQSLAFRITLAMKMTTSNVTLEPVADTAAVAAKLARVKMVTPAP